MIVSPQRTNRSGFTLVEMLVVIATTSVICALATSLIVTMFRAGDGQSRDSNERRAIQRLGDQFRSDVHAASAAPAFREADDILVRLPLGGDGEVTYRRTGSAIVREKYQGGAVVYHDTFGVSGQWQVSIEPAESSAAADFVRLSLVRTEVTKRTRAPHRWQFEAVRGSDHRHNTHANLNK